MSQISIDEFNYLAKFIYERAGMSLSADKAYLMESRLTPIVRRRGLESIDALIAELRQRPTEALQIEVTEAMMTHESFFFRDTRAFDVLKSQLISRFRPSRFAEKKLRIWCAAASTGQEPYSLGMMFLEDPTVWGDWTIEILATDISTTALERGMSGSYSQFEVQRGLPIQLLVKYFTQVGDQWQIAPKVRSLVTWRKFNLLHNASSTGSFDIILCRNVCIYFDSAAKSKVLTSLNSRLNDDGLLILGASETILGTECPCKPSGLFPGFLQKSEADMSLAKAS